MLTFLVSKLEILWNLIVLTTIGCVWGKKHIMVDQKWHFIIFYKSFYPLYFEYILGTMNGLNFQTGSNHVKIDIFFHIWIYIMFFIPFKSLFAKDWSWNTYMPMFKCAKNELNFIYLFISLHMTIWFYKL